MRKRGISQYRRAGVPAPPAPEAPGRAWVTAGLFALSVALLTLAFAPVYQFYLAWVGLVPWILAIRRLRSQWAAFFWGWGAGWLFFVANMWWMAYVTLPGMLGLMAVLALYWAVAAVLVRGSGVVEFHTGRAGAAVRVFAFAAMWTGLEWVRGNFIFHGLPWLYLGHTQSPVLAMCQVADLVGVYGVSFWVALVNAAIALAIIDRYVRRHALAVGGVVAVVLLAVGGYGWFRLAQKPQVPGPKVMVIQANYPQSNSGEKGDSPDKILDFHTRESANALAHVPDVDLVVWSETMLPPINDEARAGFRGTQAGLDSDMAHEAVGNLAHQFRSAFLVGGMYCADIKTELRPDPKGGKLQEYLIPYDRRNAAYFFDSAGVMSDQRYDKIHLVPFGEYIPFKDSVPLLYHLFAKLSPAGDDSYTLIAGTEEAMPVFTLDPPGSSGVGGADAVEKKWRFAVAICFEDIDPSLAARMFRGTSDMGGRKRADFLVNITNDGWFKANENGQHLQAAVFRSIENRVPTARSVNTGISGFIDSDGRVDRTKLVAQGQAGYSVSTLKLDPRRTLYTATGDIFPAGCALVAVAAGLLGLTAWWRDRRQPRTLPEALPEL